MKEKIKLLAVEALKNHNTRRVDVLRFLISLLDKRELQLPPGKMTEAEEIGVLRKELKNKEESKEMFAKGGRNDLVAEVEEEIKIVKEFLVEDLTDDELEKIVDDIVASGGNFGEIMKAVIAKVAGRAGGDRIAPLVKAKLNS